jgi:hypothetical protein
MRIAFVVAGGVDCCNRESVTPARCGVTVHAKEAPPIDKHVEQDLYAVHPRGSRDREIPLRSAKLALVEADLSGLACSDHLIFAVQNPH